MKNRLKRWMVSVMLVFVVSAAALAQTSGEIPVPLSDPAKRGKLKAHINYGSISIKGTARKDILVKYSAADDDDDDHDRDHDNDNDNDHDNDRNNKSDRSGLKKISSRTIELEVSENSNFVKVSSDSWSKKLNLEIEVPSGMDLQIHTYNDGDLNVSNIQGEVELTNYNGEITAMNISGSVVATTYNGEIKVTFDKVTEGAPMSFATYNGDIDLSFPAALKASLKMRTQQGEILSGFDMAIAKPTPVSTTPPTGGRGGYKVVIDEWVKGDINGGGAEFIMKNYNGDIVIRKK